MTKKGCKNILLDNIPESIHRSVKMVCAKRGTPLKVTICDILDKATKEELSKDKVLN